MTIKKLNTKPISKRSGIYVIRNSINEKVYVGQASDIANRWACHVRDLRGGKHYSSYLQRSWDKYGEGAFEFDVLEYCDKDKTLLYKLEQKWIDFMQPEYNTYPSAISGLGAKRSDELRNRLSEMRKGVKREKPFTEEHIANLRLACGSDENRRRLRDLHTGKKKSAEQRAKMSAWQVGKPKSEETRRRISESLKRRAMNATSVAV